MHCEATHLVIFEVSCISASACRQSLVPCSETCASEFVQIVIPGFMDTYSFMFQYCNPVETKWEDENTRFYMGIFAIN
jgi:hypothetical protein